MIHSRDGDSPTCSSKPLQHSKGLQNCLLIPGGVQIWLITYIVLITAPEASVLNYERTKEHLLRLSLQEA